ncbi:MAG: FAD-binding oxidoreductase [Phycisphaeraceae bacterium]|nr:FAD-binding oxidoreductase [Phycisphaeraceae bacterium]
MADAIAELRDLLGPDLVLSQRDELFVYECDGFTVARGVPDAVVFPESTEQVSQCVKVLARHGLSVVPRGSGTGLAGGAVVYDGGVMISLSRMSRIESIDFENRVAVVQAGVRNLALSDAMAGSGWRFSPDPSSQRASSIGGNASTNAGGINTLKHGVTTNHIIGMECVLPDGTIVQCRANDLYDGIGADLTGLICGSEGTFCLVTRLWCRLVPEPKAIRTVYAVFDSVTSACKSVADVIAAGMVPASMEMMDGGMIQAVEQAFHFGFPDDVAAMLLLEIDGVDDVLDEQMDQIVGICVENQATDTQKCADPARRAELWAARKKAFGAVGRMSHSYCTQDACLPRSMLPEAMAHIAELGKKWDITITNVFHAGDGNIHPIMLFDEDDPEEVQRVLLLSVEVLEYCVDIGGTITGEHGVGIEKLHLMNKQFSADTLDAFLELKKTFDPDQRLNDAKLVPSDRMTIEILKPVAANVPGGAM